MGMCTQGSHADGAEGKQPLHALDACTAPAAGALLHESKEWLPAVIWRAGDTCASTICSSRCSASALNDGSKSEGPGNTKEEAPGKSGISCGTESQY